MKIAVEAFGIDQPGGGRSSILNLFNAIFAIDRENSYCLYLSQYEPSFAQFSNVEQVVVPIRNRFLIRIWAQLAIPPKLKGYDLIHFTKNLGLFALPVPYVLTIHDLTILEYPQFFPKSDYFYWRTIQKLTTNSAKTVIAVSKTTAKDINKYYHRDIDDVEVVYHGITDLFKPADGDDIKRIRDKYGLREDYLITVGRIDVKKNLTTLIKAFAKLKDKRIFSGKLVLVGEVYQKCRDEQLVPTITSLGLTNDVILTGKVDDIDLPGLYSGAVACVFPSMHEGFGLVGLEAMACGVPLITHNASGIVEVAEGAGMLVDASQPDNLVTAIERILGDESLRASMREAGIQKASQFKWQTAAEQTVDIYWRVAQNQSA